MNKLAALPLFFFTIKTAATAQPGTDSLAQTALAPGVFIETVVHLRDGSEVRGTITEWRQGDRLFLETDKGTAVYFLEKEMASIEQFRYGDPKGKKAEALPVEIETLVYLKNGSLLRGSLDAWRFGGPVAITTREGLRLEFPPGSVKKVKQERHGGPPLADERAERIPLPPQPPAERAPRTPRPYAFRERGWFAAMSLGRMPGQDGPDPGFFRTVTFAAVLGRQLSRTGGIGIGSGVDKYGSGNFEPSLLVVPVFVDYRGYFFRKKTTPYFDLMMGHGFAIDVLGSFSSGVGEPERAGGMFISPNLGLRLGGGGGPNLTLDCGLHLQRGGYEFPANPVFGIPAFSDDLFYRRFSFRIGMVF